jgi:hypothetical protein
MADRGPEEVIQFSILAPLYLSATSGTADDRETFGLQTESMTHEIFETKFYSFLGSSKIKMKAFPGTILVKSKFLQ